MPLSRSVVFRVYTRATMTIATMVVVCDDNDNDSSAGSFVRNYIHSLHCTIAIIAAALQQVLMMMMMHLGRRTEQGILCIYNTILL